MEKMWSFLKRICLSLKLDASENCRKTGEFLEFCGFFKGLKNLEDAKDDEGWCHGGIFVRQRIIRGFSRSPFFQQVKHWQKFDPPERQHKSLCIDVFSHDRLQIFQAVWTLEASRIKRRISLVI